MKQDRRTMNINTDVYEDLSILQAEVRLIMKAKKSPKFLSKTSSTNLIATLIRNASPKELANLLDKSK